LFDSTWKPGEPSHLYCDKWAWFAPVDHTIDFRARVHGTRLSLEEEVEEAESWWNALLKPVPLVELR
jgi:hypothetical protein